MEDKNVNQLADDLNSCESIMQALATIATNSDHGYQDIKSVSIVKSGRKLIVRVVKVATVVLEH